MKKVKIINTVYQINLFMIVYNREINFSFFPPLFIYLFIVKVFSANNLYKNNERCFNIKNIK